MDQPTNQQLIEQLGAGAGTFAAKMAEISNAAIKTDHDGSMMQVQYLQAAAKAGNVVVVQSEDIGFGLGVVARRDERAIVTLVRLDRLGFESVDMEFAMTVGARTQAVKDTEAKVGSSTTVKASGGFLWMRASVDQTITADVRHQDKQTRDTDMSASINVKARMSRLEAPQGALAMADAANEFTRKLAELRLKVAEAKVNAMIEQLDNGEADAAELSDAETKQLQDAGMLPESVTNGAPAPATA